MTNILTLGTTVMEMLNDGDRFLGIGKVWIDGVLIRSGRLPWRIKTQNYHGMELAELRLLGVESSDEELRISLDARFSPLFTHLKWDHSTDPIHETGDWQEEAAISGGEVTLVLRPAALDIHHARFNGFSFHWQYRSDTVPLFFLYDMSSWELDGDITSATAISQSSCSDPVVTFAPETHWTTEGLIHWEDEASQANPVMTHNLPRWASHQAFDYQYKGNNTLLGCWEQVGLIRSLLRRDAHKAELKVFDKYIFDETLTVTTPVKCVLLHSTELTDTGQQNLWTWTMDVLHDRARAEFDLREEPVLPRLSVNYWHNFTIDSYYRDLLPAAAACGFKALFLDNLNKSNMTVGYRFGTMCCQHEVEIAPQLGGEAALTALVDHCRQLDIVPYSWSNPNQSCVSEIFLDIQHRRYTPGWKDWFIRMPDTRSPYCGAYIPEGADMDLSLAEPRDYWTQALIGIKERTGHLAYLWDSFYNSAFMPISYRNGQPRTMWRGVLQALKTMQDAGLHFMIESFGPFGEVQHGAPASYCIDKIFVCYKIMLGTGNTTIPHNGALQQTLPNETSQLYYILAHMSKPDFQLWHDGERIDRKWNPEFKRALSDYYTHRSQMHRRFLQEDGQGVLWHNAAGTQATLWNFTERTIYLSGEMSDASTGEAMPATNRRLLQAAHTYVITDVTPLPTRITEVE